MSLETDIRRLAAVPLFKGMEPDALRLMAFAAERTNHKAGELIFSEGDAAEGGLIVVSGTVALTRKADPDAAARVVGAGSLIGEHALLARTSRPVTARAETAVSLLKIPRALFSRVLEEYPAAATTIRERWATQLGKRLKLGV